MKYLKKIIISNARRFAKDVSIDFGDGATILLAPNGTGKTTVFEAIEFALTGAIQRLDRPPLALIRDNEAGVDVRLEFEDDLFCEVNYRKGSDPVLKGHHDVIFPNRNIDEIPYLVRLTHLLEQRGANWFVQQPNANEAGQLLDKLSIGKELNKIFSSKASATRSANAALERAASSLKANEEKLDAFNKLIAARSNAKTDFTLRSLSELIVEIVRIHSLFSETKPELEENISTIISFNATTMSQLTSKLEANSEHIVKLAKIEGFIEDYIFNQQKLLASEAQLKEFGQNIDTANKELEKISEEIKQKSTINTEFKAKLNSLISQRDCFSKIEATTLQIKSIEKEIADINLLIPTTKEKIEIIGKQIETAKAKNDKYKLLAEQEEVMSVAKGEIKTKEVLISEWTDLISKIELLTNSTIPNLKKKGTELTEQLSKKKIEVDNLEKEFVKNQADVNKLKSASDSISSAVSMIANNLPKDKGDCPVCDAKYSPEELHNRMTKAVSYIDPLLNDAIMKNKLAIDELSTCKNKYQELQEQSSSINAEIEASTKQKRIFEANINENIIPKFPGVQDVNGAKKWLDTEIINLEHNINNIIVEKTQLGDIVGFEELESLTLAKQKHEREMIHLTENLQVGLSKQSTLSEELNNLSLQIGDVSIENIRKSIHDTEVLSNENVTALEKAKQSLSLTQNAIVEKVKRVTDENTKNAQIKSRQSEILAEWNEVGLEGLPNVATLNKKKDYLSKEKLSLNEGKEATKKIEEELAKWKIAEEFEKYNLEIKTVCGTLSEDEYLKNLSISVEDAKKEHEQIEGKIKALRNLYSKIGAELETTHGYLQEINPRWNALLSRVVVNPRFAETSLNSYNYRNKPQAEVNVKMHGASTKVMDVASEAQITDIQLTFMLAMANTYEWTPWKGLLLDDPTQHHDLVHSASVFDLLRDYIINNKYQILLGTHDSVHANFFKRKLDNDGVPARIWNLTSDNDGVKAICLD